jgi:ribose 5-phosphate isomerase A
LIPISNPQDTKVVFDQDVAKRAAAARALDFVEQGMRLGLGTGSTAEAFVEQLGPKVARGLKVVGVPTSERTARLARSLDIPLTTLEEEPSLDLTVDGADEFDASLRLIKGGGGALLREKITATASTRMIVIADISKKVATLGRFPLPVEVNRFGLGVTRIAIAREAARCGCAGDIILRYEPSGEAYATDGGHLILDCHFGRIDQPEELAARLNAVPGVVEHGLFIGIASAVIVAAADGVTILGHPKDP